MSVSAPDRARGSVRASTSFWSAARLVAERELRADLRTKGFWILFGFFVVGIFAASILPGVFAGGPSSVAVVGPNAVQAASAADFDARRVTDRPAAARLVRAGTVDAALVPDREGSPTNLRVIAMTDPPDDVIRALSTSPPVDLLDPAEVSSAVRYLVVFSFGLTFFMLAISFGTRIAQSVVTEKQTRIVEILVATIPVRALLTGKIAGNSLMVFGQVAAIAVLAPVALRLGGHDEVLALIGDALGWFVPFFVFGFVLLAAIFATAGALVSRQEDLASSSSIASILVMFPYFGVIALHDNELGMEIMSYIPFSAPVAMPSRMFAGDVAAWEPVVALALLAASVVLTVLVASRLYSGSLLQTGGRVPLGKAWAAATPTTNYSRDHSQR